MISTKQVILFLMKIHVAGHKTINKGTMIAQTNQKWIKDILLNRIDNNNDVEGVQEFHGKLEFLLLDFII